MLKTFWRKSVMELPMFAHRSDNWASTEALFSWGGGGCSSVEKILDSGFTERVRGPLNHHERKPPLFCVGKVPPFFTEIISKILSKKNLSFLYLKRSFACPRVYFSVHLLAYHLESQNAGKKTLRPSGLTQGPNPLPRNVYSTRKKVFKMNINKFFTRFWSFFLQTSSSPQKNPGYGPALHTLLTIFLGS